MTEPQSDAGGPVQRPSPTLSPVLERPSLDIDRNNEPSQPLPSPSRVISRKPTRDSISQKNEEVLAGRDIGGADETTHGKQQSPLSDHRKRSIGTATSPINETNDREKVLRLSPAQIQELTTSPNSLPLRPVSNIPDISLGAKSDPRDLPSDVKTAIDSRVDSPNPVSNRDAALFSITTDEVPGKLLGSRREEIENSKSPIEVVRSPRPSMSARTYTTPPVIRRKQSSTRGSESQPRSKHVLPPLQLGDKLNGSTGGALKPSIGHEPVASPMPPSIPLPPLSIPTYLQLELAADRPSPLYIYRPSTSDFPYESARIKYERLLNFLWLPPQLEQTLIFGVFACLDAWLYTFTILPLRFFKALWVLSDWQARTLVKETKDMGSFIYWGLGRVWQRRRFSEVSAPPTPAEEKPSIHVPTPSRKTSSTTLPKSSSVSKDHNLRDVVFPDSLKKPRRGSTYRHRRTKSTPSLLMPTHKADILKGLLIITSCYVLMRLDASRMYHSIRGQAAIKLYVIYNVLEVCDRLFSALGQDVLECLFSRETLERNPDGRSKVLRPFWMFLLALAYNVIHSTSLFYQVITLNVAVNSYSNALLTLLMSNQFVEIKGTVFKKFEKENLFQVTCADIVERFQLSLMLSIIVLRNVFEVGVLSMTPNSSGSSASFSGTNATTAFKASSIIPKSFTVFPKINGQVLGPFLLVIGSECLVDWLKHAYITKFNNTKPAIYGRFLDVLSKDYYSNAFADQNLTKRLGLPVIPLSCLFIRAMVQTYRMFIETHMPLPLASPVTGISAESAATSSPATTAALAHIDHVFRRALGRSSFGAGLGVTGTAGFSWWSMDDLIALTTMLVVWLLIWFVLLSIKIILGMVLLNFARRRYRGMKEREKTSIDTGGKRVGGWGTVEVDDDKKRWIYIDDKAGLQKSKERDAKLKESEEKGWDGSELGGVSRYSMVAKRIW